MKVVGNSYCLHRSVRQNLGRFTLANKIKIALNYPFQTNKRPNVCRQIGLSALNSTMSDEHITSNYD